MSLPRADDIGKAEGAAGETEHRAMSRDQRFAGQFARAVGRDRQQGPVVFLRLALAEVPVNPAAGGVEDATRVPVRCIASMTLLVRTGPW